MASLVPFLEEVNTLSTGLGASVFQNIVELVRPRVCWSYQSATVVAVVVPPPVLIPELFTNVITSDTSIDLPALLTS